MIIISHVKKEQTDFEFVTHHRSGFGEADGKPTVAHVLCCKGETDLIRGKFQVLPSGVVGTVGSHRRIASYRILPLTSAQGTGFVLVFVFIRSTDRVLCAVVVTVVAIVGLAAVGV